MKLVLKVIVIFILVITVFTVVGIGYLYYLDSKLYEDLKREFRSEKQYLNHMFTIVFEESPMAFGSGHKVLILKEITNNVIDEVYFGEHPLIIKSIQANKIILGIPETDYAKSWCQDPRNDKIGSYEIHCIYH